MCVLSRFTLKMLFSFPFWAFKLVSCFVCLCLRQEKETATKICSQNNFVTNFFFQILNRFEKSKHTKRFLVSLIFCLLPQIFFYLLLSAMYFSMFKHEKVHNKSLLRNVFFRSVIYFSVCTILMSITKFFAEFFCCTFSLSFSSLSEVLSCIEWTCVGNPRSITLMKWCFAHSCA